MKHIITETNNLIAEYEVHCIEDNYSSVTRLLFNFAKLEQIKYCPNCGMSLNGKCVYVDKRLEE